MTASPPTRSDAATVTSALDPSLGRRPRWGFRVLLTMLAMYLNFIAAIVVLIPLQLFGPDYDTQRTLAEILGQLPSLAMPFGAILLVWLAMRHLDRRPLREAGLVFNAATIPTFLLGTAVATAIGFGSIAALAAAGNPGRFDPVDAPAWIVIMTLITRSLIHASFSEELLFRGYLLQTLPTKNPWVLCLISAGAFGILHLASGGGQQNLLERFVYLLTPFGFGFLAATLVLVTRNFAPAVGVHFGSYVATDLASACGWGESPAYWALGGLVYLAVGAAVLWAYQRRHPTVVRPLFSGTGQDAS